MNDGEPPSVDETGSDRFDYPPLGVLLVAVLACFPPVLGYYLLPFSLFLSVTGPLVGLVAVLVGTRLWLSDGRVPDTGITARGLFVFAVPTASLSVFWLASEDALSAVSVVLAVVAVVSGLLFASALFGPRVLDSVLGKRRFSLWFLGALTAGTLGVATLFFVGLGSLFRLLVLSTFALLTFYLLFIIPLATVQRWRGRDAATVDPPHPTLSVIVPAYNEEGYVGRCIESVLESSYPNDRLEVVVVDDGSTDGTYAEAARYRSRGVEVYNKENGGKHSALNYGLHCSSGEYVVCLDADGLVDPGALTEIAATLQADPGVGAVAGNVKVLNRDRHITRIQAMEYLIGINTFRWAFSWFGAVPVIPGCLGGFRREALEESRAYDPDTLTEDFDMTVQVLKNGWEVRQIGATVWTEAPFTFRDLFRQRLRWYSGTVETFLKHPDVFLERDSGFLHRFVFPVFLLRILLAPLATIVVVLLGIRYGEVSTIAAAAGTALLTYGLLALLVVDVDEDDRSLVPYAPLLLIGYKQWITAVWIASVARVLAPGYDRTWIAPRREKQVQATSSGSTNGDGD